MNIFYTPDISSENYILNEEESKHCVRVLRLKKGDEIFLVDGKGGFYKADIIDDNAKKCSVIIKEKQIEYEKKDFYLHIGIAPTKNIERLEWFLEKATEIGVDEITPLICKHSERKEVKNERLEKVIISAMKQSIKAYLPKLNSAMNFKEFTQKDFKGQKFIAHLSDSSQKLQSVYQQRNNVLILVGPEGDFSEEEINSAEQNSFQEISLGNSRLRTETAGLVACEIINLLNE